MRVTFLGTGSSGGTPGVFQGWGNCDPANPKNRRLRPSILVQYKDTRILVDSSPDFREQCLRSGIRGLDAVLYTHAHADHLHGIDDLRAVNRYIERPLPCYADEPTLETIRERFGYVFEPLHPEATVYYKPTLEARPIADGDTFTVGDLDIRCFEQDHGFSTSLGFRIGGLGYCTDLIQLPDTAFDILTGVDTLVVGVFRDDPHETHAHTALALKWVSRIRPRQAFLTHLSVAMDHDATEAKLPRGVRVAYDGLIIECTNTLAPDAAGGV